MKTFAQLFFENSAFIIDNEFWSSKIWAGYLLDC
jgi:hypothetical protein